MHIIYIILLVILVIVLYTLIIKTEYFVGIESSGIDKIKTIISEDESCFKYECPDMFEKNKKSKKLICWKCFWKDDDY